MRGMCLTFAAAGLCAVANGARLTSQSYVQDGLIAQFDAIENVGVGQHEDEPKVWKDLKGSASITIPSGVSWIDRALDSGRVQMTIAGMPAFWLDSVSTEMTFNRIENGPANNYPRVIHHPHNDGWYSVYFSGTWDNPQMFVENRGSPRPNFNAFNVGTLGMTSTTNGYRTYNNGSYTGNSSGSTVVNHVEAEAADWVFNRQSGYLRGYYRSLRHYDRGLTADEFARNAQIDLFRFYSYSVTGTGTETALPWATAGWAVPHGNSGTYPNTNTNDYVQVINAKVSVAAADGVVLKGLSLEDGAKLSLAADATVRVQVLWVEGEPVPRGVYTGSAQGRGTKVAWLEGAGVVCVAGTGNKKFPVPVKGLGAYSYVQDGLVTQLDAVDNVGTGAHDAEAAKWLDLVGNVSLTLNTNTTWNAGRYFLKAGDGSPIYFGTMPAYVRDSITCEVPINISASGSNSAGGYPRVFANGESFSIYFIGGGTTAYVYLSGQTGDPRPNLGSFRTGTIAAFSGATAFGGAINGVVKSKTGSPATKVLNCSADSWGLGHAGMLKGSYGGLRFYNRCLTEEELVWNTLIDKFRFFSYVFANEGEEIDWSEIHWGIPEGQTAAAPSSLTNQYVTVSRAQVSVTAADDIALMGLSLENDAKLAVPADVVVSVKMLYVNGVAVEHGIYTGTEGTTGMVASWVSGAGQVRVAGGTDRRIPTMVATADADGWYTFGLASGGSQSENAVVGEHPIWDEYAFPTNAKLRLVGYILLDTVPDVFVDYDTTQLKYAIVNGARAYAADRTFDVPQGASIRYYPGTWTPSETTANKFDFKSPNYTLARQLAGDVRVAGTFYHDNNKSVNVTHGGCLTGDGQLRITNYGRQVHFTGGFALNGDANMQQNGNGFWVDTLAVTSSLKTVTLAGCTDSHGMTENYSASFVMFGKDKSAATADHPLNVTRLNGNASSRVDAAGRRWRSGGHVIVWGSNTVHVGALHASIHAVASRKEQDCTNEFLNKWNYTSVGIGILEVDNFNTGTIYGSTNVALKVGNVAANTAFDFTYQSNDVNRLTLDITESCAAATTIKATDLAMLPARISGFKGNVTLTETEARSYEIPFDFTAGPDGLGSTVGCVGSGTLVAAPETSTVDITFPTEEAEIAKGKYPVVTFDDGGNLLRGWTVTLNGERTTHATVGHHAVSLIRNQKGIWLGVDQPGAVIIVR